VLKTQQKHFKLGDILGYFKPIQSIIQKKLTNYYIFFLLLWLGRAIAQAVSRRLSVGAEGFQSGLGHVAFVVD
jgi:hypothetical protein